MFGSILGKVCGLWFRIKFRVFKFWADGIYVGCLGSGYDYGSGLGVPSYKKWL